MEKNNTTKEFADLIKNRRTELNLSQKDIADKLYITEQAVSKWERGLSYPDISNLPKLAEILGISAEELIYGKLNSVSKKSEDKSLDVVKTLKESRNKTTKKIIFSVTSIFYLVAIAAVIIINLAIDKRLTWSYLVVGAIVFAFLCFLPIIFLKGIKKGYLAVLTFAVFSIPYVYLVSYITQTSYWIKPLVIPIILATAVFVTAIIFLSTRGIKNQFIVSGINFFLSGVIFNYIINKIVNNYLVNTLFYPLSNNSIHSIIMVSFFFASAIVMTIGIIQGLREKYI